MLVDKHVPAPRSIYFPPSGARATAVPPVPQIWSVSRLTRPSSQSFNGIKGSINEGCHLVPRVLCKWSVRGFEELQASNFKLDSDVLVMKSAQNGT
jgi:hypothetical protein